jgi:Protein of unknown function (DUF2844)
MRVLTLLTMLFAAANVFASLGGTYTTVQDDGAHMKGAVRVRQMVAYDLHEITAPTGVRVREFVSPQGRVFGVAWDGPVLPDMQQVLGEYYADYIRAAQEPTRAHGQPLVVRTPNVVIYSGGHMRSMHGSAYVPQLMPANVKAEEVR